MIVSCGAHNFELSYLARRSKDPYRSGTSIRLTKGVGMDKDKRIHTDSGDPEVRGRAVPARRPSTSSAARSVAAYGTPASVTGREDLRFDFGIKSPQLFDDAIKDRVLRYAPTRFCDDGGWTSHLASREVTGRRI